MSATQFVAVGSGSSSLKPPIMVSSCFRVVLATALVICSAWSGSSSASVASTLGMAPSAIAMPISVLITLLVTEKTWW